MNTGDLKDQKGQALVEYAILIGWLAIVFSFVVTPFCQAFDSYIQGVYFILQAPFP